jgi:FMN-dependent NADH-azoreductase
MTQILQIDSSINGSASVSSSLAASLVENISLQTQINHTHRDLNAEPIPHLTGQTFQAFNLPQEQRNEQQQQSVTLSDQLIAELATAELIVLALPMYNFGIPSGLKAWIDHVARAGITFKYTDKGPVGLMGNKKLIVVAARGGVYSGTPADNQSAYIRQIFGFMGIEDIDFIYAEGLGSPDNREQSIQQAADQIGQLTEQLRSSSTAETA